MYQETFKNFMKLIRPFLKQQGFRSRGNNFHKRHPEGNIGMINFQKNPDGLPKFTINIGVYSIALEKYLLAEFNQEKVKEYPSLGDYHWNTRVGSLVPKEHPARKKDEFWYKVGDKWWSYNDTTDVEELFQEISPLILTYGIPAIDKHLSDKQLIDKWFAITSAGDGGPTSLKYLCILFNHYGEQERLNIVLKEFGEFMQNHPELTGLKKHYERFMKEAADSKTTQSTSEKRIISTEEPDTAETKTKKMKR